MLLDLREKVRNSKPIKYTLITVICIPFALVGIGSYFAGGEAEPVATVNGTDISPYELDRAAAQQRARLAEMFGGELPPGIVTDASLKAQALDQLVMQRVMEDSVADVNFQVGDAALAKDITSIPQFQTDGQFDTVLYSNFLQSRGLNAAAFEQGRRVDVTTRQFSQGVLETSFVLPQETAKLDALKAQTRTVDIVRFDMAKAQESTDIPAEDVDAYFVANTESYQFPERAKLQYISLDRADIEAAIDVTDEEAQSYFDENIARYTTPAQREASHILLSVDDMGDKDLVAEKIAAINAAKQRIDAGESFADVAKELSDDVGSADNGGSLGAITAGSMVSEFEEAVNSLNSVGEISEAVTTDFGIHLIKLDALNPETIKPFAEVKEEVITAMKSSQANEEYRNLREILTEQLFENPEALDAAAEASGLELKTSDWIDSSSTDPLLGRPQIIQAAFSEDVLVSGNNSDLIELSATSAVAIRVQEHEAQRPKALDDVKDEIISKLKVERASAQLDTLVNSAVADFEAGKSASDIASGESLATATSDEKLERQSTTIDRNVLTSVYALAKPVEGSARVTNAVTSVGDRVAVLLKSVSTPEIAEPATGEEAETAAQSAAGRLGGAEFSALMGSLRAKAKVSVAE